MCEECGCGQHTHSTIYGPDGEIAEYTHSHDGFEHKHTKDGVVYTHTHGGETHTHSGESDTHEHEGHMHNHEGHMHSHEGHMHSHEGHMHAHHEHLHGKKQGGGCGAGHCCEDIHEAMGGDCCEPCGEDES